MSVYDIPNFVDSQDSTKEYKYKILVYPNITFQKGFGKGFLCCCSWYTM